MKIAFCTAHRKWNKTPYPKEINEHYSNNFGTTGFWKNIHILRWIKLFASTSCHPHPCSWMWMVSSLQWRLLSALPKETGKPYPKEIREHCSDNFGTAKFWMDNCFHPFITNFIHIFGYNWFHRYSEYCFLHYPEKSSPSVRPCLDQISGPESRSTIPQYYCCGAGVQCFLFHFLQAVQEAIFNGVAKLFTSILGGWKL